MPAPDSTSSAPRAIFWDMDGTLVNTEPLWGIATMEMSEAMGRRLSPQLRAQTVGGSFYNTVSICARHAGITLDAESTAAYKRSMFNRVGELMHNHLEVYPGIRELLGQLADHGIAMYVTTNTERVLADSAIAAIGADFFVGSITGDEVESPKPAPEMYLNAARLAKAHPQDCLVFEDSTAGMTAAAASGARVIGLPEDDNQSVPGGVVPISDLHHGSHLDGVSAEDVFYWFEKISVHVS